MKQAAQHRTRWGIVGTGDIANRFATDLKLIASAEVVAVASRTKIKASDFAQRHEIKQIYLSVKGLAADPNIDVVYIASPHALHAEHAGACLDARIAVLCEKPLTTQLADTQKVLAMASANKTFLMEGLWNRFLPTQRQAESWVRDGRIGDIRAMTADFGFCGTAPRLFDPAMGGGALLDIGIYPLDLALRILGELPERFESQAILDNNGVDLSLSAKGEIDGSLISFTCSIVETSPCLATIEGSQGRIEFASRFHEGTSVSLWRNGSEERFQAPRNDYGFIGQIEHVGQCLGTGLTESSIVPHLSSLQLAQALDRIRHAWR